MIVITDGTDKEPMLLLTPSSVEVALILLIYLFANKRLNLNKRFSSYNRSYYSDFTNTFNKEIKGDSL